MKKAPLLFTLLTILALFLACKKRFAEPTYATSGTAVRIWYKTDPYYYPQAEIFLESTNTWRSFLSFPLVYDNDPNKYGFGNPWVLGKGSNALNMTSIYSALPGGGVSADSGLYNITIPKCFEFIPNNDTAKSGKVNVIPQKVNIYRRDKTLYQIGISGGGTYNEAARLFEVEVIFDETSIGGSATVKRNYRFRP